MIAGPTTDAVEAFLSDARHGQGRAAVRLALDLLDRGVPSDDVIVKLLAAAQFQVGERWLNNEWSVADEHLATGVAQKALDAVADCAEPPVEGGLVVVTCAPGDWHSLPAQMFAELLRSRGFAVAFLGASTPVDHAERLFERDRPDAIAVSCSLPLAYRGLMALAEAAHRHGIPVIAGGRALGGDSRRSLRLGADAWGVGVVDASEVLSGWHAAPPDLSADRVEHDPAIDALEHAAPGMALDAFAEMSSTIPRMADYDDAQVARTKEDLIFIVQFVVAARLAGDPSVLTDFVAWLGGLLAARGVPSSALDAGIAALAPLIAEVDPEGGRLAVAALAAA